MLGVIIGVAAVISMVALGSGARGSVETSLKSAGTNIIQISAGNFTRGGESMNIASGLGSATTLTMEDASEIRKIAGGAAGRRRRAQSRVCEVRASAVLHAGPRSRAGARRSSTDGSGWPAASPVRLMRR